MKRIKFTKMVASGNDFVVSELTAYSLQLKALARRICDRKYGIGADGLLVLEKSRHADIRMRVLNADGSEAEMCGNGARCVALFMSAKRRAQDAKIKIQTRAGIINSEVHADKVRINLTDPKGLRIEIPIKVAGRSLRANFINTGVPHTVIFVEGLDKIDVKNIGREIRYHKAFSPAGTNVNFVEVVSRDTIRVRTYERGVEDETLACGTGSTASALISSFMLAAPGDKKIKVLTQSGEVLKVYFKESSNRFLDVWLEGRARVVYTGEYLL
jgi:diaminopimelate epimerase